jgi:hypothetical protein
MAPLTDGIPCPRRYFNATGLLGALDHFIRFRNVDTASLAHYNLSSVLRFPHYLRRVAMVLTLMPPARFLYKLQDVPLGSH